MVFMFASQVLACLNCSLDTSSHVRQMVRQDFEVLFARLYRLEESPQLEDLLSLYTWGFFAAGADLARGVSRQIDKAFLLWNLTLIFLKQKFVHRKRMRASRGVLLALQLFFSLGLSLSLGLLAPRRLC